MLGTHLLIFLQKSSNPKVQAARQGGGGTCAGSSIAAEMAADIAIAAQSVSQRCLNIAGIDFSSKTLYESVIQYMSMKPLANH